MDIRRYSDGDLEAILEIYNKSKLDEFHRERNRHTLLPLQDDLHRFKRLMASDIYVVDLNDSIIAYGAVTGSEIRALYVHPDARGKSVGTQLLQHLLAEIGSPATLYVAESNSAAKLLYKKHGFVVVRKFNSSYNGVRVIANEMVQVKTV